MSDRQIQLVILDCDGVLINHHQGFLLNLYKLRQDMPQDILSQQKAINHYDERYVHYLRQLPELGFCAIQCFCFADVLTHFGLQAQWREMLHFARSIGKWPKFEDAFGALHYLKKFYRVMVRCDREKEDVEYLKQKFQLSPNDILLRDSEPDQIQRHLRSLGLTDDQAVVVTNPINAQTLTFPHVRVLSRAGSSTKESLATLIFEHQENLRGNGIKYALTD